jgi:hypothetical protein
MPGVVPANPAIYHITHLDNLSSIVAAGGLWSDSERLRRGLVPTNIGHKHIKQRRLNRDVNVAVGGKLGDYVPFNFCNRSVMLFVVSHGHQDYAGGQENILHLVSSVHTAVALNQPWAFTDLHADLGYATYFTDLAKLSEVNWNVMPLTYWSAVKDTRQAEFLVHEFFPWRAVEQIGVINQVVAGRVRAILGSGSPPVEAHPDWYY